MASCKDKSEIVKFLSTVKGFDVISTEDLSDLVEQVEVNECGHNDYLMRKGEEGDVMHVLWRGRVRIPVVGPDGKLKLEVTLEARSIVGEMALLTSERRTADVISAGTTETLAFRRDVIQPFLYDHPSLARFLTEVLVERIDEDQTLQKVGKYRLGRVLGAGATSKVYEGLHGTLSRLVAMKMLSHTLAYDREYLKRFVGEADIIAGLSHPNIVQIYDLEEAYGTYFIILEIVSGRSLEMILNERPSLSPDEASGVLRQLALALAHAHEKGIVHRDVKPGNCIVDGNGHLKLMDFGISRRYEGATEAQGTIEGSPAYIAPEVIAGKQADGRVDIYSLGAMAFKIVTGRNLFALDSVPEILKAHVSEPPPDPRKFCKNLPDGLHAFITGALEKDPDKRLSDWHEIMGLLGADATMAPVIGAKIEGGKKSLLLAYPEANADRVEKAIRDLEPLGVEAIPHGTPKPGAEKEEGDTSDRTLQMGEATELIDGT